MGLYQRAVGWMGKASARCRERHLMEYRDRVLAHKDNLKMHQGVPFNDLDEIDLYPISAPLGASIATGLAGNYLTPNYLSGCLIAALGILTCGMGLASKFISDYKQIRNDLLSERGLLDLHKKCLAKKHFSLEDALTLEDYVI